MSNTQICHTITISSHYLPMGVGFICLMADYLHHLQLSSFCVRISERFLLAVFDGFLIDRLCAISTHVTKFTTIKTGRFRHIPSSFLRCVEACILSLRTLRGPSSSIYLHGIDKYTCSMPLALPISKH